MACGEQERAGMLSHLIKLKESFKTLLDSLIDKLGGVKTLM